MIKLLAVACVISFATAGWFLTPALLFRLADPCESRSLYIIDEGNRRSVTEGILVHSKGLKHFAYSARISLYQDNSLTATAAVERTVDLDSSVTADAFEIKNVGTFILAGPQDTDPTFGPYIDPVAKAGFSAHVYVFRTGRTLLSGFRDRPRWICQRHAG